jgi:L-ascorbate metabolism protein UlaG (beta-lactamase superfamily)
VTGLADPPRRRTRVSLVFVFVALALSACGATHTGPISDHFDGQRFYTPGIDKTSSPIGYLWRRLTDPPPDWPSSLPSAAREQPTLAQRVAGPQAHVTYIGHATLLIQIAGLNILTDPMWSERASAVSWLGPKRVVSPALPLERLPPVDVVLVSHDHYDHLDIATLTRLDALHRPRVIAPLGTGRLLKSVMPQSEVGEHDWGERVPIGPDVVVHVEPMAHGSGRTPFDQMQTLWAAYVIKAASLAIYHVGDAGYAGGRFFRDVAQRHGPLDLAILPIGAYEPVDFMADSHMRPADAVRVLADSRARLGLAHHFDTFQLGFEAFGAAGAEVQAVQASRSPAEPRLIVPKLGQTIVVTPAR